MTELGASGGIWTSVASLSDSDNTAALSMDTGTISTTFDEYRVTFFAKSHSGTNNSMKVQLNGDTSSSHNAQHVDGTSVVQEASVNAITVFQSNNSGTAALDCGSAVLFVTCPTDGGSGAFITGGGSSGNQAKPSMVRGTLNANLSEVNQFTFSSDANATGQVEILGRDV